MAKRFRADQLIHQQGLAESREKAKRLIMAGLVYHDAHGQRERVSKPGQQFPEDTDFAVQGQERFVSRGGEKLLTAIEHFGLDFTGLVCLDAGASTGGFTDCMLQHGATKVYAVDVGHAQLHEKLQADPRVISKEKTTIKDAPSDLLPEQVDAVVIDVSFIPLKRALPGCVQFLKPGGFLIALVKPQFELERKKVVKGVVRDEAYQQEAVDIVTEFSESELGLTFKGVVPSKIKGPKGNQEYLSVFTKE